MFKIKLNLDGTIAHYKACLIAQGYKQQEGINYHKTFSLVAKITIVSMFITIIVFYGCPIKQLDVSNYFFMATYSRQYICSSLPTSFIQNFPFMFVDLEGNIWSSIVPSTMVHMSFFICVAAQFHLKYC